MSHTGFDGDGRYVCIFDGSVPTAEDMSNNGVVFIAEGSFSDAYYFVNGIVEERPTMPLAGLIGSTPIISFGELYIAVNENLRVENIPDGAQLDYYDGPEAIDDNFFEWYSAKPGLVEFKLSLFPFNDVNIDAYIESP